MKIPCYHNNKAPDSFINGGAFHARNNRIGAQNIISPFISVLFLRFRRNKTLNIPPLYSAIFAAIEEAQTRGEKSKITGLI
ncbi:hypothetical protein [Lonsdalea quercina]|uniref:hypothetical protein n=1 Tax=Lonsdalea quercina TaxID=71657 RepID=UPI00047EB26A|nr:hypothetical protein [Lonsdalea quercina]